MMTLPLKIYATKAEIKPLPKETYIAELEVRLECSDIKAVLDEMFSSDWSSEVFDYLKKTTSKEELREHLCI